MAPPRRPGSRTGGAPRWFQGAMVVVAVGLLLGMALPSGAFTLMSGPRGGAVDVSADQSGILGLTVYTCVDKDTIDPLVDTTNNFGSSLSVTVSLVDGTLGTLHVGAQSGDTVTYSLASGGTDTVSFETTTTGPWPKDVAFTIDATTGGSSVTATRSSQIDNNCGSSTPTPTPTATPTPTPTPAPNDPPTAAFTMTAAGGNKMNVNASASSDSDGTIVSYEWYINNQAATGNPDATGETATLNPVRTGDTITLVVTDDDGATDKVTKTA